MFRRRRINTNTFETLVGAMVLLVAALFLYVSIEVSDSRKKLSSGYEIVAEFNNIDGINAGTDVKIAGVKVGSVMEIKLNDNYNADVIIKMSNDVSVPVDSIFKISTSGIIGSKFINIKVGSDEETFKHKDKVEFTESAMDLEDLISRFIFNSGDKNEKNK